MPNRPAYSNLASSVADAPTTLSPTQQRTFERARGFAMALCSIPTTRDPTVRQDPETAERMRLLVATMGIARGGERREAQQNFPIKSGETACLFLQHFIRKLRTGGGGGAIKNTFLSNTDGASVSLRKELLESCNLHTVLDCPCGTFQGADVKTVVLFFMKARRPGASGTTSSTRAARSARPTH